VSLTLAEKIVIAVALAKEARLENGVQHLSENVKGLAGPPQPQQREREVLQGVINHGTAGRQDARQMYNAAKVGAEIRWEVHHP